MAILIDGYNLLNATGVEGIGRGTELERARRGLLRFLASVLSSQECAATTIVFDAQNAPPGLPNQDSFAGMTILFSRGYAEADDLLEELIAADHAPRTLLVVSSDHRLHRAARKRRATAIDSDVWINQLESRSPAAPTARELTSADAPENDSEHWLKEFSDIDVAAIESELAEGEPPAEPATPTSGQPEEKPQAPPPKRELDAADADELANPFPEGFGEELKFEIDAGEDPTNPFPPEFFEDDGQK